ncbi:MAG: hypothetical protein ACI8W8_000922 [Rhodothermales bacterium]|jgi:hypothetical protein
MLRVVCACLMSVMGMTAPFDIIHFPQASYRHEGATFVLQGEAGTAIAVTLDEQPLAEFALAEGQTEHHVVLNTSGLLRFASGDDGWSFRLLLPEEQGAALNERDGYLYSADTPALLLAAHQHPPKHDRRWEALNLLRKVVLDTRPEVASCSLLGANFAVTKNLDEYQRPKLPAAFYDIHRIIAVIDEIDVAPAIILSPGVDDLNHGMDASEYIAKIEWCLQALVARKHGHVFLAAPPDIADYLLRDRLRLAAGGNSAIFLRTHTDGWSRLLNKELSRTVKWSVLE